MTKRLLLVLLFVSFGMSGQVLKKISNQANKAYEAKDYPLFLQFYQKLDSLRPAHPLYNYNLAVAYALNGKTDRAVETLRKSVLMNNATDFENDADLSSIKNSAGYAELVKLKAGLAKPVANSLKVVSLDEKDLHPEGLTYLQKSKKWLATSIRKGKIVSFDPKTGKCADWLTSEGMLSVFAMKADAGEKFLWVATSGLPEMKNFTNIMQGKGEVLKVDIKKKKIVQRFPLSGNHIFGDIIVSKKGDVFISDSNQSIIYKIANDAVKEFLNLQDRAFNLQGMAFNDDQSKLYIADYLKGILEIPMNDIKANRWLDFPEGTTVKGIDGLLWYKNSLVAVQNGVKPIRILQLSLGAGQKNISGFRVIDHNRPEFNEPANGFIKDGTFYFFANCPWNAYGEDHNLIDSKYSAPELYSVKL